MSDTTLKKTCVINPATDRAVKADGKIGKRLLETRRLKKEGKVAPAAKPKLKTETPPAKPAAKKAKPAEPAKPAPKKAEPLPNIKDTDDTPFINEPTTATGKYNLPNRVKFINNVKELVKNIKNGDCVEPRKFGNNDGYTVRNIINLEQKIGTESAYGVIYLTKIAGASDNYKIASKLFKDIAGNKNEIKLMDYLTTNVILKQKSRHFLALYNKSVCKDKELNDKLRLLSINELAHGDLKGLVEDKNVMAKDEQVINMFIQVMISIATFQKATSMRHADCHFGNILYQKNNEKGFYHYKCDGKDYYLPTSDYNMMLYDFGLAKKYKKDTSGGKALILDYYRIIHAFINRTDGGWCEGFVNTATSKKMNDVKKDLLKYINNDPDSIPDNIIELINTSFPNVFTKLRPPNVINAIPFEI